jgi:pyruvate dehydrogenase E1 component alpha subunit
MNKKLLKNIFLKSLFIRKIEREISIKYSEQQMRCPIHLSIGQELQAVVISQALSKNDIVFSNHRSHAHYLSKGCSPQKMICELYGKKNGCLNGRGGSMHLQDISKNFFGSLPIVGSALGLATGTAFSQKRNKKDNISVVFLGDGTMEEGIVHESMNFSSIFKIPLLFVCENNFYSIFTHLKDRQPNSDMTRFAKAHEIKNANVNAFEISKLINTSRNAIKYVRENKKPFFLQINTYRFLEHCGPGEDDYLNYRPKNEINFWKKRDPLILLKNIIYKNNTLLLNSLKKIEHNYDLKIKEIFRIAKNSEFPNPDDAEVNVYAK